MRAKTHTVQVPRQTQAGAVYLILTRWPHKELVLDSNSQPQTAKMASIMQRRMVSLESYVYNTLERVTNASQLSKEDEKADEVEVRREDQDKINRFSRLHQRELALNEELKTKNVRIQRDEILDTS